MAVLCIASSAAMLEFYQRHVQLLGRVRGLEEPMFLAADGVRPYTYSAFSSDFSSACVAHGGAPEDKRRLYPMLVPHLVLKDD